MDKKNENNQIHKCNDTQSQENSENVNLISKQQYLNDKFFSSSQEFQEQFPCQNIITNDFIIYQQQINQNDYILNTDQYCLKESLVLVLQMKLKLNQLKQQIQKEIKQKQQNNNQDIAENLIMALRNKQFNDIKLCLNNMKEYISFKNNNFIFQQSYKNLDTLLNDLSNLQQQFQQSIESAFNKESIELCNIPLVFCKNIQNQTQYDSSVECSKNQLIITAFNFHVLQQYYLDYNLNQKKKYKLRFQIQSSTSNFAVIGIMQKSKTDSTFLTSVQNQYFCYSFNGVNAFDQTIVLKGKPLLEIEKKESQFEMRIDFENNYIDFYDYPQIENINRSNPYQNFEKVDDYVITILMDGKNSITLQQFCSIQQLENLL